MRILTDHKINQTNQELQVRVLDEPDHGGACHSYMIEDANNGKLTPINILFQNGPIKEDGNGINGVTIEAILAILIDRLKGFQSGPYACYENDMALISIKQSLDWLKKRTVKRVNRGVEGTHVV